MYISIYLYVYMCNILCITYLHEKQTDIYIGFETTLFYTKSARMNQPTHSTRIIL